MGEFIDLNKDFFITKSNRWNILVILHIIIIQSQTMIRALLIIAGLLAAAHCACLASSELDGLASGTPIITQAPSPSASPLPTSHLQLPPTSTASSRFSAAIPLSPSVPHCWFRHPGLLNGSIGSSTIRRVSHHSQLGQQVGHRVPVQALTPSLAIATTGILG